MTGNWMSQPYPQTNAIALLMHHIWGQTVEFYTQWQERREAARDAAWKKLSYGAKLVQIEKAVGPSKHLQRDILGDTESPE